MELVRRLDQEAIGNTPTDQRYVQRLLDRATGATSCSVSWIRTPSGGGSPEGRHVHEGDQVFYVLAGTMHVEVRGEVSELGPGSLVLFPAGVAHRNWNEGAEPTVHIAINVPAPDPDVAFARPAD